MCLGLSKLFRLTIPTAVSPLVQILGRDNRERDSRTIDKRFPNSAAFFDL